MNFRCVVLVAALGCGAVVPGAAQEAVKLSAHDRAQGWRLLFDGRDTSDWRGYRANKLPPNWRVEGGSLAGSAGPALVSAAEFGDFELTFDWRVAEGGHGEVYFRVDEEGESPAHTGPVMLLSGHGPTLAGNGLGAPDRTVTPQFGVWYRAKLLVFGNQVEHWLNGDRVHGYMLDTAAWREALAASQWSTMRELGQARQGRIALAGDRVEFRNIKVRGI